jgi:hypothetical protein
VTTLTVKDSSLVGLIKLRMVAECLEASRVASFLDAATTYNGKADQCPGSNTVQLYTGRCTGILHGP